MCPEWRASFDGFYSDLGPRPHGTSLDRIDNDGNYEPGNCRWATAAEQLGNRRCSITVTHEGETLSLTDWAERFGIPYGTILDRYHRGRPLFES